MRISRKAAKRAVYSFIIVLLSSHGIPVSAQTCSGPTVKPSVNISTSTTFICSGSEVKFVATATNCGATPSYQWKINNANAGNNSDTFATASLNNGDIVNCLVTADPLFACASPRTASSYGIAMNVSSSPIPSINVAASANDVCPCTVITFAANTQNANPAATYQWTLNNDTVGTNNPNYSNAGLQSGDEIFCLLTDSTSCYSGPVKSNIITISLKAVPSIIVNPVDTFVAAGSIVKLNAAVDETRISNFGWQPPGDVSDATSLSPDTKPILSETNYVFDAVTVDGCAISKKITIGLLRDFQMPNAFTPNGDGRNDVFRIPPHANVNLQDFSIFDRWGHKVFSTNNSGIGWDGNSKGVKQDAGVYIYVIKASGTKGKIISTGSFVLIR